jgi:serine/threonine protein kinase
MTPERWQEVEQLYYRALEYGATERAGFLDDACAADNDLRHEVESLLGADTGVGSFMKRLPADIAAGALGEAARATLSTETIPASMAGRTLGHYQILAPLGAGGMGEVYVAQDTHLRRKVALKLLRQRFTTDAEEIQRFKEEAHSAAALNHPNIITVLEIEQEEGLYFIATEYVDGQTLHQRISSGPIDIQEALDIAIQVANALATAHEAGILHRDIKPANIMLRHDGYVKVLDFGLAKLVTANEEYIHTQPGWVRGTPRYMSPEQVLAQPLDGRSDLFSFGIVLYEMITGKGPFDNSTSRDLLGLFRRTDPPPLRSYAPSTPAELERIVKKALAKDRDERYQSTRELLADLTKLRLDLQTRTRRARVPSFRLVAGFVLALTSAATAAWMYRSLGGTQTAGSNLVRLTPDDGHGYSQPAISPDGEFVAYVANRSGKAELWLQQVGGDDPIQLTHSEQTVSFASFFPDGKRLLYVTTSADLRKSTIEVIATLGGQSRVLIQGGRINNEVAMVSPDGREIAYFEDNQGIVRLMVMSSDGGQPRELPAWARMQGVWHGSAAWTSDSRYLLCVMPNPAGAASSAGSEWFAFPVDGGEPVNTRAVEALWAAGLGPTIAPRVVWGDRVLFMGGTSGPYSLWEIRLSPGSWRVKGAPHQLASGIQSAFPMSISTSGTVALEVGHEFGDLYLIPLSPGTGQPTGISRRLTKDGRNKRLYSPGGYPGAGYFWVLHTDSLISGWDYFTLDLESGKQTFAGAGPSLPRSVAVSPDGWRVAYSVPEGDSYSIQVGDLGSGTAAAGVVCKACGQVQQFSPDGRSLFYSPKASVKPDPLRKSSVRLLDLPSGRDRPWAEHPTDSVSVVSTFGEDSQWLVVGLIPSGSQGPGRSYVVPWTNEAVSQRVLTKIPLPDGNAGEWRVSPARNFAYRFEGSTMMAARFNPRTASFDEPHQVKFVPGSQVTLKPGDDWAVRRQGLIFSRVEYVNSAVWLMKLPR